MNHVFSRTQAKKGAEQTSSLLISPTHSSPCPAILSPCFRRCRAQGLTSPPLVNLYQFVPICINLHQVAPICTSLHQCAPIRINHHQPVYQFAPICANLRQFAPICIQSIRIKSYQLAPICTPSFLITRLHGSGGNRVSTWYHGILTRSTLCPYPPPPLPSSPCSYNKKSKRENRGEKKKKTTVP